MQKTENTAPVASTVDDVRFADLGLSESVLSAVEDMGYETPTPVQAAAIPEALAGRDVLAAAQTGTGKTAAFLLPTMDRLPRTPKGRGRGRHAAQGPLMLVVTPTRELAQQIEGVCRAICGRTGHRSVTVVGGVSYNPQKDALKRGCDILIATPGRLLDLIDQQACSLDQIQVLVLDEADRMLDMGFLPAVRRIVGYTPDDRQTLLFSATLDEKAVGSITDLVRDPARIEIAPVTSTADTVDQYVLPVSLEAKNALLAQVLKREGASRVIVFTRTKHRADACCRRLARAGITCAAIHGNRTQGQRDRALKSFRSGECEVLVATDVLARGIDISDVRYVVNFDVPVEPVDYIHRIGRTGRAGEVGWSLTFVTVDDIGEFFDIEAVMGKTVESFDPEGLELGLNPPAIDPDRVPAKRPAGKKVKKRRRAEAQSRREGDSAKKPARRKRSGRARVREEGSSDGTSTPDRRREGSRSKRPASAPSRSGRQASASSRPMRRDESGVLHTDRSSGDAWRNYDEVSDRRSSGRRRRAGEGPTPRRTGRPDGRGGYNGRTATRRPGDRGGRR